jgi:hypothetical protein
MGFELNRIMKQYGVSTPGMANYSGATAPSTNFDSAYYAKANPDLAKAKIDTPEELLKHYTDTGKKEGRSGYDTAAFGEQMRKYGLDQKSYDTYKTDYQNRLQNTPMYIQSQFDTGNRPVSDAMKFATTGTPDVATGRNMGVDKFYGNIKQYVAENPYASTQALLAQQNKIGMSNQDAYNATGSYYGNQLKGPTYGAVNTSMVNDTPQAKADYYLQQRNLGYTDADMRNATTSTFGKPAEGDWAQLTARAYPQYNKNIVDAYGSIGRSWEKGTIDAPGYNYWMNQLSTGAFDPKNLNSTFAQAAADEKAAADAKAAEATRLATIANTKDVNNKLATSLNVNNAFSLPVNQEYRAHGGSIHSMTDKYAMGGPVKTHYQTAGAVNLPSGYSDSQNEAEWMNRWNSQQQPVEINPVDMSVPPPPVTIDLTAAPSAPKAPLTEIAAANLKTEPVPVTQEVVPPVLVSKPAAAPFGDERMGNIQALLAAYGPKDSAYAADLKLARESAKAESDAFANMLKTAMSSPDDEKSSKAEMYFRLAAAFGAPTKTGQFSENLGMVGKELGEYAKNKRASGQQKLALGLEAQKLKMAASKEDLNTLRSLSAEEMKDKRTIATELIKDYIKSGEPQSTAGKQALDEGLKPGTDAYQKRVAEIGNLNVEGKMAQISASLANMNVAAANLALSQNKFENQKAQQAKLTGPELKLKTEAEDLIASSKQSLADLKQAYALNPNSLAGGWLDKGQQFLAEAAGSKDPVIVNTRILNNLLGSQGLAKLKATFGGAPTEGERAILMELEGIGSKTKEERSAIIKRTYKVLQDRVAREQARLDQITSGAYRTTTPLDGGTD